LGFHKTHILTLTMGGSFWDKYETIKQELLSNPRILSMTQTNFNFRGGFGTSHVWWEGKEDNEIQPLILMIHPWWRTHCHIKISPEDMPSTLAFIDLKLKELVPEYPFELRFFEEDIDRLYRTEQHIGNLVKYGAILAVFVACLGLFGLASFTAKQRTKEIAIRKVLGASLSRIAYLFSKEFAKWVLLANVIAWPVSYFVMRKWLQGFAYRTPMSWEVFALSALLALGIVLITVGCQALKSAMSNPSDYLRYE